ncbi:MAG: PAS domain S-box protein [Acidobacteria bacterium]|nr:PAS domain S-box protein [Acidobacteriota bacterium]
MTFADPGLGKPLEGVYDPALVALSVSVACLGGVAAVAVADRIRAARRAVTRAGWLVAGASAMGGAIWAMHFTGMMAFSLGSHVRYDLECTVLSILPGLLGSAVAIWSMARPPQSWARRQPQALAVAAGIGAMHYIGMEAMDMPTLTLFYHGPLFLFSLLVAHGLATLALQRGKIAARVTRPVVLGLAAAGMHYTAMAASRFYPAEQPAPTPSALQLSPTAMSVGIVSIATLILACALIAVRVDRWLADATLTLHDTELRERTVLESMVEGVLLIDSRGLVKLANPAAKRMFGYEADTIRGVSLCALLPGALPDCEADHPALRTSQGRETIARRRDGAEFPVEFTAVDYQPAGQRLCSLLVRDISRRKQSEQQLRQAQKLESIGQLAAGIAHEINTPTQYLSDNIRFLQDSFGELCELVALQRALLAEAALPPEIAERHDKACSAADLDFLLEEAPRSIQESLEGLGRISTIVRSLKEFSHPDGEEMTSADLNRALSTTITVARPEWKYVAEIETDFDDDLPPVRCHLGDINQVFLNLIVNAAQAIGGGESIGRKGVIRLSTRRDDDFAEVRVEDNGPGIPPEILDRIFDPFFTTKDVGVGTGQGLAIAHRIIGARHGGSIRVESEPGEGATFIVRLPLAGVEAPAAES